MLACARIGAVHSVVFGGFSAESLRDRINDSQAKLLITADGGYRRGQVVPLKQMADEALDATRRRSRTSSSSSARPARPIPVAHEGGPRPLVARADAGRVARRARPRRSTPRTCSTSSTPPARPGKPKGIVHTTGGYLVGTYATTKWVFDLQGRRRLLVHRRHRLGDRPQLRRLRPARQRRDRRDVRRGARTGRAKDRFWEIIERHGVTIFYTAPTAIRAFMRWGTEWPAKHDLSVAAPARLGRRADQSRGVDLVSPAHRRRALPDRRHLVADRDRRDHDHAAARASRRTKPGSATRPFPGIVAEIVDADGQARRDRRRPARR